MKKWVGRFFNLESFNQEKWKTLEASRRVWRRKVLSLSPKQMLNVVYFDLEMRRRGLLK